MMMMMMLSASVFVCHHNTTTSSQPNGKFRCARNFSCTQTHTNEIKLKHPLQPHTSRNRNQRARHSFSCENSSCRCVERPNEPHPYKSYIEFCPLPLFCCVGWTFRTVGKFLTLLNFDKIIKQVTILINFDYFTLKSN